MSLSNLTEIKEGLTYDDVLLVPAYSEVLPNQVQLSSKVTRNIEVNMLVERFSAFSNHRV